MTQRIQEAYEFRSAMELPIHSDDPKVIQGQLDLIFEEYNEFCCEVETNGARVDQLKELSDLVYVCYQFAAARGWDLDQALERVHQSNMTKLVDGKCLKNSAGKVLKGPYYTPPFLNDLV
jgi:predicted HAD superfamily Cof-like phosphohydrolase